MRRHGAVAVALLGFVFLVLPRGFSVDEDSMRLAVLTAIPALVLLRAWRISRSIAAVVAACVVGALVALAANSWRSPRIAYFTVYALLVFLLVSAYAVTARRRRVVALALWLVAIFEVVVAWTPWHAGGDPNGLMRGTLQWHNQFAAFLLGPALVAVASYARDRRPLVRTLAAVTVACAGVGIVLSTSRAGLGLLMLGWLALAPVALRGGHRWFALARWASVPGLVVAGTFVLTSSVFFADSHYSWPLVGDGGRGPSTMEANSSLRVTYVKAALAIFWHHPVFGAGFGSYPAEAAHYLPAGTRTIFGVYNAWVDGLMSGGLVYGVPLLAVGVGCAVVVLRGLRGGSSALRPERALVAGAAVGAAAVLGHVAFDADTYYPQILVMLAALIGLVHAATTPRPAELSRELIGHTGELEFVAADGGIAHAEVTQA